jgi:hypothetical protein
MATAKRDGVGKGLHVTDDTVPSERDAVYRNERSHASRSLDGKPLPTCLRPDHRSYHAQVVATIQQARIVAQQAQAIDQSWWRFLCQTYELTDEDTVNADGTIVRAADRDRESSPGDPTGGNNLSGTEQSGSGIQ